MNKVDSSGGLRAANENNELARPNTELLEKLHSELPQYIRADGSFDVEKFLADLRENNIAEARDGYRLGFVGKDYARLQTGLAPTTMLVPDVAHNSLPENADSGNVFITGDNLEALRHLQNAYRNKVKMIYIDPPYNTGKEFVYNDSFEYNDEWLRNALGYNDNEIARLKSIQGKSSHSAWLTFMYPRLSIAQKLLTDDGVIFISIDDNEQANLKLLMDEVFGEGNFVAQIVWERSYAPINLKKHFSECHDYILCYAKYIDKAICNGLQRTDETNNKYSNPDNDPRGLWRTDNLSVGPAIPDKIYEIITPSGRKCLPPKGRCWVYILSSVINGVIIELEIERKERI